MSEPTMGNEMVLYSVTDVVISEMAKQYMTITVADETDEAGAAVAHKARQVVKKKRIEVENRRVELKANALAFGKKVDSEANRIKGLLAPIEDHLDKQERIVTDFKKRQEEARLLKLAQEEQARKDAEESRLRAEREVEEKRLADERAKLAAERDRLMAERSQLAARQQEAEAAQKAERDRLAAIEAKQREAQHEIEIQKARVEAAERARVETEQRLAREAEESKRRKADYEEQLKAEKARMEAMLPDVQKIHEFGKHLSEVETPFVKSEEARSFLASINDTIEDMSIRCREFRIKGKCR